MSGRLEGRINTLTVEQACYLAGLFDGEGTFTITRWNQGAKQSPAFRADVTMSQARVDLLFKMKDWIGGGCYVHLDAGQYKGRLSLCASAIREFVPQILPYLILKREQAEIVLAFLENVKTRRIRSKLTLAEWDEREKMCLRVKGLNSSPRIDERWLTPIN